MLPKSWLSVHGCWTEIHSYGGEGKNGFICLPGKGVTQEASASRTVPLPWRIGRGLIDVLLVRECDKNQGSNSLEFFFSSNLCTLHWQADS